MFLISCKSLTSGKSRISMDFVCGNFHMSDAIKNSLPRGSHLNLGLHFYSISPAYILFCSRKIETWRKLGIMAFCDFFSWEEK